MAAVVTAHIPEERWMFSVSHDRGVTWKDSESGGYPSRRASEWIIDWLSSGWGYLSYQTTDGNVVIRDRAKRDTLYRWRRLEP
jgi:hypothetical protein